MQLLRKGKRLQVFGRVQARLRADSKEHRRQDNRGADRLPGVLSRRVDRQGVTQMNGIQLSFFKEQEKGRRSVDNE